MDFFRIGTKENKDGTIDVFPDWIVGRSKDLMVRAQSFYAIWDEEAGLWSTDEYDVQRLVDEELQRYANDLHAKGFECHVKYLRSFGSKSWTQFRSFLKNISDNSVQLDQSLTFANDKVKKSDYRSRRLPYSLAEGDISAWEELIGTLYPVEERQKIEWAIGAVVSGDAKQIQKFLVLYGPAGTGKSTVLNIIADMFPGYATSFEAKALGSNNHSFATEAFRGNPLIAIQHDGDLSRIDDNTKLNSIIAHEDMVMNEKFKPSYTARINAFLFMGTNQPVKITDAKSGIIRRLIDVHPTGIKIPSNHYTTLMSQIQFELGAIAHYCLQVYRKLGKNYYNNYRPVEMMLQTDVFFNFIEAHFDTFKEQDSTTLRQAYAMYKEFCSETGIERTMPQYKVREELRNYFRGFKDREYINGETVRSYYYGFSAHPFKQPVKDGNVYSLVMDQSTSLFDLDFAESPAQYANDAGTPKQRWVNVKTTLAEIDTSQVHFVKVPENHIVIDFDLKDENGDKSLERNLEAASRWPATYAEISQGGNGIHLHYDYDGDTTTLAPIFSEGVEIKVYSGDASLRRRLSRCNNVPVAVLNGGLPIKEKKPMLQEQTIKSEKGLRDLIARNLRKEIHPGTKPSVDFIKHILDEAYESGMPYNVKDLQPKVIAFANASTHQPLQALKIVQQIKWQSDEPSEPSRVAKDDRLVFFDVEVFPNLFVLNWKYEGDSPMVKMINPEAHEVEALMKFKLVGYNCRRYDNHIVYARMLGYNNEQLFQLSQKIIKGNVGAMFGEAYGLSYADIYDFASEKKSLKKWMIELGMPHVELDIPWDQPVPEELIPKVADYCGNDVEGTEAVFNARRADFAARQILAELSGLTVNDTTAKHTARIIFGNERNPQSNFVYTDLSTMFPGYKYDMGKSTYRGEEVGEGGYVHAKEGMYKDVVVLDIASMHPTSIVQLDLFGPYTEKFQRLMNARLAIKHGDTKKARDILPNADASLFDDEKSMKGLSDALKIVINTVYGLTAAKFDNPFRDVRNIDNIVAKRGALFMVDLKHFIEHELGLPVIHIKTDSVKVESPSDSQINKIMEFGKKYGYTFEHEDTYERFCLVNDAVYVARDYEGNWTAVGAQFQHPYVFKTLFSKEDVTFDDLCETKQVQRGVLYLDFDAVQKPMFEYKGMVHVGKIGRFCPVTPESGGGILYRVDDDGKKFAASGTSGFFWTEAHVAESAVSEPNIEIDMAYFENLTNKAIDAINKFGNFEEFVQ